LTGTSTRPHPLTPKKDVRKRAELCETIATRPPTGTPISSSVAACARARRAISAYVISPQESAGWSGSSTTAMRSG
jgi:hypothetical protein